MSHKYLAIDLPLAWRRQMRRILLAVYQQRETKIVIYQWVGNSLLAKNWPKW
jgi:hypothetical protein